MKREEREARDNLLEADDLVVPRNTPESIVKSWITAARERRVTQAAIIFVSLGAETKADRVSGSNRSGSRLICTVPDVTTGCRTTCTRYRGKGQ